MSKVTLLAVSIVGILTGCGGSDSGTSATDSVGTVVTGMDGYYQNAVVFDDVNKDGVLDISGDTIYGLTNASGQLTLPPSTEISGRLALQVIAPGGTAQSALISYDASAYSGVYTIDTDYPGTALTELVLQTTAGADNDTAISPISDLVATLEDNGDTDALQTVANALGITSSAIHQDYIDVNNSSLHKIAQILSASKSHNSDNYQAAATNIITETVTAVRDMADDELSDINNVPVVTVSGDQSSGYSVVSVTNSKATVSSSIKSELQTALDNLAATKGGTLSFSYNIASLFNDSDLEAMSAIALNYSDESTSGVTIALNGTTLTLSSNQILSGEDIDFSLSIVDYASDTTTAVGSASVSFELSVASLNSVPTANSAIEADIQAALDGWIITQGDSFTDSFTFSGLFTDADSDTLTYSGTTTATGLRVEQITNDTVVLSGTPSVSGSGYSVTITATDGEESVSSTFDLPEIAQGTTDQSTSTASIQDLMGPTWYYLEYGEDDGDDSTSDFTRVWCQAIRFADGVIYGNQRSINDLTSCDVTADQQQGTYIINGDTLLAEYDFGDEGVFTLTYSLKEDELPAERISSGALTVLLSAEEEGENSSFRYTYFSSPTDAAARIQTASDDGFAARNFAMWLPTSSEGTYQLGSIDISIDSSEYGEDADNADADIFFNPAQGGSITCADIHNYYDRFVIMSSAMNTEQTTNEDYFNSWEYGHGISTSECYDHSDENDPYAAIDFDFSPLNLTQGAVYSIIGFVKDGQGEHAQDLKFNIEWTGSSNNQ